MKQPQVVIYPINDIVEWYENDQLILTPKFQRRNVWSPMAKSYLIDTIVRSMPIPPIFIRPTVNVASRKTYREVVDGQQRLRAIMEYINGEFTVLPVHNRDLAELPFARIPEKVKQTILEYKITTNLLENISDADVLEVFARINTYTLPLNPQELRNSRYLGPFKQAMYRITHRHYQFFRLHGILNDEEIARMEDVELVSQLAIGILQGPTETQKTTIDKFYEQYNEVFPLAEEIDGMFFEAFTTMEAIFGQGLRKSQFSRTPLFYSFFLLILESLYDLSDRDAVAHYGSVKRKEDKSVLQKLKHVVAEVEENFRIKPQDSEWKAFKGAIDRGTANTNTRTIRDRYLRSLMAR